MLVKLNTDSHRSDEEKYLSITSSDENAREEKSGKGEIEQEDSSSAQLQPSPGTVQLPGPLYLL